MSLFDILFELLSAYGTNGLTMGSPTRGAALSADFGTFSKLVLIAVMLLGRHRHMPTHTDAALDRHVRRLQARYRETVITQRAASSPLTLAFLCLSECTR